MSGAIVGIPRDTKIRSILGSQGNRTSSRGTNSGFRPSRRGRGHAWSRWSQEQNQGAGGALRSSPYEEPGPRCSELLDNPRRCVGAGASESCETGAEVLEGGIMFLHNTAPQKREIRGPAAPSVPFLVTSLPFPVTSFTYFMFFFKWPLFLLT